MLLLLTMILIQDIISMNEITFKFVENTEKMIDHFWTGMNEMLEELHIDFQQTTKAFSLFKNERLIADHISCKDMKSTLKNTFPNIEACLLVNKLFLSRGKGKNKKPMSFAMMALIKTQRGKFVVLKRKIRKYNYQDLGQEQYLEWDTIDFNAAFLSYTPFLGHDLSTTQFLIWTNPDKYLVFSSLRNIHITEHFCTSNQISRLHVPGMFFNPLRICGLFQSKKKTLLLNFPYKEKLIFPDAGNYVDFLAYHGSDLVTENKFLEWYVHKVEQCYICLTTHSRTLEPDQLDRKLNEEFAIFTCSFMRAPQSLY